MHHLIDPHTGWPAESDLVAVTVSASSLWLRRGGRQVGGDDWRRRGWTSLASASEDSRVCCTDTTRPATEVEVVTNMEDAA